MGKQIHVATATVLVLGCSSKVSCLWSQNGASIAVPDEVPRTCPWLEVKELNTVLQLANNQHLCFCTCESELALILSTVNGTGLRYIRETDVFLLLKGFVFVIAISISLA